MCNFAKWIVGGHVPMTSGKPITASTLHLIGVIKRYRQMTKRLTTEEFINKARKIHGDKYDYSKVEYINYKTKVLVVCKKCGRELKLFPDSILKGLGCNNCYGEKRGRKHIYPYNADNKKSFQIWYGILQRTLKASKDFKLKHPAYNECEICDEWMDFAVFNKWFEAHYIEGFQIDKDLLSHGNKIYSPSTCVFLPQEINNTLSKERKTERFLPVGVWKHKDMFTSTCNKKYIGLFKTVKEAREAYLTEKKKHIIELANKWKDKIEPRAYDALINLDVEKFFNN